LNMDNNTNSSEYLKYVNSLILFELAGIVRPLV